MNGTSLGPRWRLREEGRRGGKGLDPPPGRARLPFEPPGPVLGVVGEVLVRAIGITAHRVEWEGLDVQGLDAVRVAVLGPAVQEKKEVAPPPVRQGRQRPG